MTSSIYFTSTRNIRENDIINAFENKLQLGKIDEGNVNIVPVSNQDYNHVFFNITWNETSEAATFFSELILKSSVKVFHNHNHGYWLCRMNRNPLKLRNKSAACIKFASLINTNPVPVPVPRLIPLPVPVSAAMFNEDDFYVIN